MTDILDSIQNEEIWQTDLDFGFPTIGQYKKDCETHEYDKICVTEVLNADLSITTYGKIVYKLGCTDVLNKVQMALKQHGIDACISLYTYGYKNFILAGTKDIGEQEFLGLMRAFYNEFENSVSKHVEVSGVSRFVVVLQKDHMLERALNTLAFNRDNQENFLISDQRLFTEDELDREALMFELLGKAVKENLIVPYYQGIRNNDTGEIDKYEALMRIVDVDGTVYPPGSFLEIAKKYKLYNRISQMMIDRAINEFKHRSESLSLNISLYDIRTPSFKKWFLDRLQTHPRPDLITLEFVETEDYNKDNALFDFVEMVRSFGCKVSVDDFGTGYATYAAIISLKPDYIKVDGQIIRDIVTKSENRIILQSICFMTDLIESQVIAEYVENEDIQNMLVAHKVAHSQGYHFSKPRPIDELP